MRVFSNTRERKEVLCAIRVEKAVTIVDAVGDGFAICLTAVVT